jgi:hypothetical protein
MYKLITSVWKGARTNCSKSAIIHGFFSWCSTRSSILCYEYFKSFISYKYMKKQLIQFDCLPSVKSRSVSRNVRCLPLSPIVQNEIVNFVNFDGLG